MIILVLSLINNLNLVVTYPNGRRYHGNIFEEPFDSRLDTVNNVEAVFIQDPVKGKYKIRMIGSNVIEQVQDFALVYSGEISLIHDTLKIVLKSTSRC